MAARARSRLSSSCSGVADRVDGVDSVGLERTPPPPPPRAAALPPPRAARAVDPPMAPLTAAPLAPDFRPRLAPSLAARFRPSLAVWLGFLVREAVLGERRVLVTCGQM